MANTKKGVISVEVWLLSFKEYKDKIGSCRYKDLYLKWRKEADKADDFAFNGTTTVDEEWHQEMRYLQERAEVYGNELKDIAWRLTLYVRLVVIGLRETYSELRGLGGGNLWPVIQWNSKAPLPSG